MSKLLSALFLVAGIVLLGFGLNGLNTLSASDPFAFVPPGVTERGTWFIVFGLTAITIGSASLMTRRRN